MSSSSSYTFLKLRAKVVSGACSFTVLNLVYQLLVFHWMMAIWPLIYVHSKTGARYRFDEMWGCYWSEQWLCLVSFTVLAFVLDYIFWPYVFRDLITGDKEITGD
jgi:hypothetical protein